MDEFWLWKDSIKRSNKLIKIKRIRDVFIDIKIFNSCYLAGYFCNIWSEYNLKKWINNRIIEFKAYNNK